MKKKGPGTSSWKCTSCGTCGSPPVTLNFLKLCGVARLMISMSSMALKTVSSCAAHGGTGDDHWHRCGGSINMVSTSRYIGPRTDSLDSGG